MVGELHLGIKGRAAGSPRTGEMKVLSLSTRQGEAGRGGRGPKQDKMFVQVTELVSSAAGLLTGAVRKIVISVTKL